MIPGLTSDKSSISPDIMLLLLFLLLLLLLFDEEGTLVLVFVAGGGGGGGEVIGAKREEVGLGTRPPAKGVFIVSLTVFQFVYKYIYERSCSF